MDLDWKDEQVIIGRGIERLMNKDGKFKRVNVDYLNYGYKVGQGYYVKLYENDYDYIVINLNFKKDIPVECYIEAINSAINTENYHAHIASPEEKYVHMILDKHYEENYEFDLCYVNDGCLYKCDDGGETAIDFSSVGKINYDYATEILKLEETDGYRVIVDFKNNTMVGIDPLD